jgi:hypothetical protein
MTEQDALLFMAQNIVVLSDDDGTHFGVCMVEDGDCTIESPDKLMSHTMADDVDTEIITAGAIAALAGVKMPYAEGETVILLAPTAQAVNAVYPDDPQWVEDTTSVCLGTAGMYALFTTLDRDALVGAAEGKSNPWVLVA